jgi:hypothetical protein
MPEERASKMPGGWWIPVVAAVVGLVGGIAGAYVGGQVSNDGQEQQFKNQREAELQDLLVDAYTDYLRANSRWFLAVASGVSGADEEELRGEVLATESQVEFLAADDTVDHAAQVLFDVVDAGPAGQGNYDSARDTFIDVAGASLGE